MYHAAASLFPRVTDSSGVWNARKRRRCWTPDRPEATRARDPPVDRHLPAGSPIVHRRLGPRPLKAFPHTLVVVVVVGAAVVLRGAVPLLSVQRPRVPTERAAAAGRGRRLTSTPIDRAFTGQ